MTYRMRSEVPPVKRLVNLLVRAADPGAAAAERRLRLRRRCCRRRNQRRQRLGGSAPVEEDFGGEVPEEAYIELYRCRPPPVFVPLALLAVLIGFCVCAVQLNAGPAWNRVGWATGLPYTSPLAFCPTRRHEVWRFATYALLHDGWHHLAFNTGVLLLLGLPLQLAHCGLRVAATILGGVLLGSLLSSVVEPGAVLVGAGGAAYALVGAHIGLALANWAQLSVEWRQITAPAPTSGGQKGSGLIGRLLTSAMLRLVLLVALVYADFAVAIYQRHWRQLTIFNGDRQWRCWSSYAAQPAGLAWGLLVGTQLLSIDEGADEDDEDENGESGHQRRQRCQRCLLRASLAGFAAFAVFATLWNVFNTGWYSISGGLACGVGTTRAG